MFYICIVIVLCMFVLALMRASSDESYVDEEWLKEQLDRMEIQIVYPEENQKCQPPDGVVIKPDGIHELDPCIYEEIETHYNCTVHVLRCKQCGHVELEWEKQKEWIDEEVSKECDSM